MKNSIVSAWVHKGESCHPTSTPAESRLPIDEHTGMHHAVARLCSVILPFIKQQPTQYNEHPNKQQKMATLKAPLTLIVTSQRTFCKV